jgi:HAD superfamily hydrolase (TIGR01509 family)
MICDSITGMDITAVVFDMDGVLLDTETMSDRTWESACDELGLAGSMGIVNECRGCNRTDTMDILRRHFGADFDASRFLDRTSELFHEMEAREGIPVMKGAAEALSYLKHAGYRLALASSTRGVTVRRQLAAAGLIGYFETLTTGDMVTHSKPDPEIYRLACASLSVPPQSCAAVEDSPNGIRSAHSAGLSCIMVPDKIQPDSSVKPLLWKLLSSLDQISSVL